MNIRTAGLEDLAAVSQIHALSWKTAYRGIFADSFLEELSPDRWMQGLKEPLARGELRIRILEEEGRPIGCVSFGAARDAAFSGWGEVVSLHLLSGSRGKGYGSLLLRDAVCELEKLGYSQIYLWVLEKNEKARKFYEKNYFFWNGDRLVSEEGGGTVTDLRYLLQAK